MVFPRRFRNHRPQDALDFTPFAVGGWLMMSMIIHQASLAHLASEFKLDLARQAATKRVDCQL
jgi:hypothetical protein